MAPIFSKEKRRIVSKLFAIHLQVESDDPMNKRALDIFKRDLVKKSSKKKIFKNVEPVYDPKARVGLIAWKAANQIVFEPSKAIYIEKNPSEGLDFNAVAEHVFDYFKRKKELADVKLLGKVYELEFEVDRPGIDILVSLTGMFADDTVKNYDCRVNIVEGDKNVHLWISASYDEEDLETQNIIKVRLDINNFDQESGIEETAFNDIVGACDDYMENRLIDKLNSYFAIEAEK